MRTLATGAPIPTPEHRARGFTLLEVLVVVVIMAIVAGLAVMAVQDDPEARIRTEAERFSALLRLASQEAVLQSRELAIELNRSGYHFLVFGDDGWRPADDDVLRPRTLPEDVRLVASLEGAPAPLEPPSHEGRSRQRTPPRVYLLSGGEVTPFEATFEHDRRVHIRAIVRGDALGRTELDVERP